jgi:non-ribosomal peptide synthetase component F
MSDTVKRGVKLPPEQQSIRAKCLHPSATFVEFPMEDVESSIPARCEKIVWQYPDYTAIKAGDEVVTYAKLNAMANRVARVIAERAGNNAVPIAVLIDKGVKQIAAMMGVLKAARPFVLLDGSLPKTRLAAMVEDCSPELTVTDGQSNSLANELMPADQPVISFDSIDPNIPSENLDTKIAPDALACIVHTSGSTGQPKGVMYNQNTLLHHVMLRTNADGFCALDRIPHFSSGTANAITNTFFSLLNGAALLPFDVNEEGTRRLIRWLSQERITVCLIVLC